jgi:hypothetical protein
MKWFVHRQLSSSIGMEAVQPVSATPHELVDIFCVPDNGLPSIT